MQLICVLLIQKSYGTNLYIEVKQFGFDDI